MVVNEAGGNKSRLKRVDSAVCSARAQEVRVKPGLQQRTKHKTPRCQSDTLASQLSNQTLFKKGTYPTFFSSKPFTKKSSILVVVNKQK